ncbi:uroporphyrinogen-III C-methyltransferase [bacterium]|nr:MAG: uroporphyrinogen-III C-methyltransferase [bacterium]
MNATVSLVGAGPGDIGLLTIRGLEILKSAEVVVYDALVNPELIDFASDSAEKIYVGKRAGAHSMTQDEINAVLIEKAVQGKSVCRLKGGDPFVFGRGGEEALACYANEIPFEIVPGVTSSIAAPAYAGIPVTHREVATSFAVVTGHTATDDAPPDAIPNADTLVFLMGVKALPLIVAKLLGRGDSPEKPVALVRWGTRTEQQTVVGTLATIEAEVAKAKLKAPALIVVGDVVKLREKLRWFDNRPLWGQTVIVTRAREQASSLVEGLRKLGAKVVQCPTIRVEPLESTPILDEEIPLLMRNNWVVFTSTNGVEQFFKKLDSLKLDARVFGPACVAAIGPATASALQKRGIICDYLPESSISENVAAGLLERGAANGRTLVIRAQEGREVLEQKLRESGATVTVAPLYRTLPDDSNGPEAREMIERGEVDWVTFTSSSTVKNFVDALGAEFVAQHRAQFKVAAIGPVTSESAIKFGLQPDVVSQEASVEALAAALSSHI